MMTAQLLPETLTGHPGCVSLLDSGGFHREFIDSATLPFRVHLALSVGILVDFPGTRLPVEPPDWIGLLPCATTSTVTYQASRPVPRDLLWESPLKE